MNNELRLYFFVMYNLSGIQKGIQAGHAALEYARFFGDTLEYQSFISKYKTFILLDGGGSIDMKAREKELKAFGIPFVSFLEPDLNLSLSAVAFLVDESIYGFKETDEDVNLAQKYAFCPPCEGRERYKKYVFYKYLKSFKLAAN